MDSFKDTRRQLYGALIGIVFVFSIGVIGFSLLIPLEPALNSPLDALWLTTITLTTIGYGDITAETAIGRSFTIALILFGFGIVAYGLQAAGTFLISPEIRELRAKKRTRKAIRRLSHHYIICGSGELVDQTIAYLLQSVQMRLAYYDDKLYRPIDNFLDGIFGDDELGHYPRTRAIVRRLYLTFARPFIRGGTLLDLIIVITEDTDYARHLREAGFFVQEGAPTDVETLQNVGVERATAIIVALPNDTETLLTVLAARSASEKLYITAATQDADIAEKIWRVGANNVVRPFELAGQFLNSVTLRPTVHDFFNGILFDHTYNIQMTQINLVDGAAWVGKSLVELRLTERYHARIIGIYSDGFVIAPPSDYTLSAGEDVIIAAPASSITGLQQESGGSLHNRGGRHLTAPVSPTCSGNIYPPEQVEQAVAAMHKHFIICAQDDVARSAIDKLDPERPFVVVCPTTAYADELTERGFRVIRGNPAQEDTLRRAGAERALAIMISLHDEGDTVLAIMAARALNDDLLITTTASDSNTRKIKLAGADRVISPFSIAAQYILLSTTRPTVSAFFQHVLYNRRDGIETTELYMEDHAPWIGQTIADLDLRAQFAAQVIGVRRANGTFIYAPPDAHTVQKHEVLMIVTPMENADRLRTHAHGSATKRPNSLRRTGTTKSVTP